MPPRQEELGPAPRLRPPGGPAPGVRLRRRLHRTLARTTEPTWLEFELGVCSQNGEDGVLQAIFQRIGVREPRFVEFGVGTGAQGNCVLLADYYDWAGLFMESDPTSFAELERKYRERGRVRTRQAIVTAENIEELLAHEGVPPTFDLLSIDTDGNDYWIWAAIRRFEPRVVVIEYNANLDLERQFVMPRDDHHRWDGTDYFGASLGAYRTLAESKGYRLVHTDRTGTNAFFVHENDASALQVMGSPALFAANYHRQGIRLPRDPQDRPFLDLETGQLVQAERSTP